MELFQQHQSRNVKCQKDSALRQLKESNGFTLKGTLTVENGCKNFDEKCISPLTLANN